MWCLLALTFAGRPLQGRPERWRSDIRRIVASGLVNIGVLFALFAGVFRYVDQHFHTPAAFLENTSELAGNAEIRERLFDGFRSEIITLADGDVVAPEVDVLEDLLAEDAADDDQFVDPVIDPVTQERIARDQAIEEVLLDVFDSAEFNQVFTAALTGTQQELIASADLEDAALLRNKGEVFFDMRALYRPIYDGLRVDPRTAEITQTEVPPGYGVFKVADRETTVNFLWTLLGNGPNWRGLTMAGAVLSLIGAIAIADRRPSTAIQFGGGVVGVAVVLLVVVYLIRFLVPLLAGGGSAGNSVVAVYAANTSPLVGTLIRMIVVGLVLAAIGGIARLIWPDDWVYSSVSDDRGIRSIRRRRGEPEPSQQQQLQPAAMSPGYGGYAQPPYPGYAQGWPQPYPGYAPGYGTPYPAGPYAQPAQPLPQHYQGPSNPTVPVMPVKIDASDDLVPPAPPPLDAKPGDLPADAAQAVPRVVATADSTLDETASSPSKATVVETGDGDDADESEPKSSQQLIDEAKRADDDAWAGEKDW